MLVVMNANATEGEIAGVVRVIESLGLRAHIMPGSAAPPLASLVTRASSACSISRICRVWPKPFGLPNRTN